METLGEIRLRTFLADAWKRGGVTNHEIRRDAGTTVGSFADLVEKVAHLAFYNRDHVLLFRGQDRDYRNQAGNTTIQPSILRRPPHVTAAVWRDTLLSRYERLRRAEAALVTGWRTRQLPDARRLENHRSLRWAILQHYEVCPTPLLDVTHSLRVAASFATHGARQQKSAEAFLYVLAVPQISGAITASAEAELQILRLSGICPPTAARPHFQEGYLLGNYPDLQTAEEKERYDLYEVDFARRLLGKFRLDLRDFWQRSFPLVPKAALYPTRDDALLDLSQRVAAALRPV
jgi:hypothetical protein